MEASIFRAAALICGLALAGCRAIQGLDGFSFDGVGGGGSSGSGSSGGGGAIGVEDCTNDVDDDGDGLTDCADHDCEAAGYACVAAPPDGWSGPAAFFEGPFAEAVPPCPGLYPDLGYQGDSGPEAQAATCDECACAAAQITCAVSLALFGNGTCKGSGTSSAPLTPGSCVTLDVSTSSLGLSKPTTTVDACKPSGGIATIPPLQRSTSGVVCEAPRRVGGCSGGEICAPRPPPPFLESRCISSEVAKSCPASYPEPHRLEKVADDRGCSPCSCDAAAPPSCTATTTLFSDMACGVQSASLPNDDGCVPAVQASVMVAITGNGTADCVPKGGTPIGAVALTSQATICCSK